MLQPVSSEVFKAVNSAIYIYIGFFAKTAIIGHYTVFHMATVYLVFLKNKNTYIKVRIKLFVK